MSRSLCLRGGIAVLLLGMFGIVLSGCASKEATTPAKGESAIPQDSMKKAYGGGSRPGAATSTK
ncbi:MAG: hypothetical protein H7308_02120 [Chthonomonadaceae bacterium]|nr:hypothetical protein [Chthonomonadaceae bacterium]